MGKEVYFDRIEQEIEYGNYSEVKRIALTILRSNPENKDASYIRDFIEYHKKSNGRYGNISLSSYLYYISRNIEKFRKTADNEMFLSCFYNDLFHTDNYNKGDEFSLNISNSEIKKAMELLRQLSNPDLDKLIKSLDDIQKDFDLHMTLS